MGQPQSVPQQEDRRFKGSKSKPEAPEEWKNDADFLVVSPVSDISNPSQFRGRLPKNNVKRITNRTSKVCPKARPRGLPPPTRFYFTERKTEEESESLEEPAPVLTLKEKAAVAHHQRTLMETWKAKCIKAKQQMGECFFMEKAERENEPLEQRRYSQRPQKNTAIEQKVSIDDDDDDRYMQFFEPDWKDNSLDTSVVVSNDQQTKDMAPSILPSVANHSKSTLSSLPVGRELSMGSTKSGTSTVKDRKNRESVLSSGVSSAVSPVSTVIQTKQNRVFRPTVIKSDTAVVRVASIEISESKDSNDTRRNSISTQMQVQIDNQVKLNDRIARLRKQYREQIAACTVEVPKRVSVAELSNAFEKRSVSAPRSRPEPTNLIERNDRQNVFRSRDQRSVSAPRGGGRASMDTNNTRATSRRVSKAPRPSIDGSALLHLSGWNNNKQTVHQQIPALLAVTGWQKPNNAKQSNEPKVPKPRVNQSNVKQAESLEEEKKVQRRGLDSDVSIQAATKAKQLGRKAMSLGVDDSKHTKLVETSKRENASLPLPRREPAQKASGRTIALMLQQAYFKYDETDDDSPKHKRMIEPSPLANKFSSIENSSPADSAASSAPLVSDQACFNSEFLFNDNTALLMPEPKRTSENYALSTIDSRSRMSSYSADPVEIPAASSSFSIVSAGASTQDYCYKDRRVRFSDVYEVSDLGIERKLSDLSDTAATISTARESDASLAIQRIDSIPEEEEDDEIRSHMRSDQDEQVLSESDKMVSFKDQFAFREENSVDDESTPVRPRVMRWSYRQEDEGLGKGVTPLMSGFDSNLATNSPYLRFKEAKSRFAAARKMAEQKTSPAKKKRSPLKPGKKSLVLSRIEAVEGRRTRSDIGIPVPKKRLDNLRRATTDHTSTSTQSRGRPMVMSTASLDKPATLSACTSDARVQTHERVDTKLSNNLSDDSSTVSDDSDDAFGAILHPTTIDEDSPNQWNRTEQSQRSNGTIDISESDSSGDAFDNLLNYQEKSNLVEKDDASQSTVIRKAGRASVDAEPRAVFGRRRTLSNSDTVGGDTAASGLSSILRNYSKDENTVPSAVIRKKAGPLGFRAAAPVKPSEQNRRAPYGQLETMREQNTRTPPLQAARKWRALAAAAHERDSKQLSERNINTIR